MENKLAGLMAIMAFIILSGTWLVRTVIGLPVMGPIQILSALLFVIPLYYFVVGRVIARIGISLIQEELSDNRVREEEIMHRSRMMQKEMEEENADKKQSDEDKEK